MKKLSMILAMTLPVVLGLACIGTAAAQQAQTLLPGATIPKFVDPLPVGNTPGGITVIDAAENPNYDVFMMEFSAQILPKPRPLLDFAGYPKTRVWGYRTWHELLEPNRQTYVGPLIVAKRNVPVKATYRNDLRFSSSKLQPLLPFDLTIDWANPLNIVCRSDADGNVLPSPPNPPGCVELPSYAGKPQAAAAHIHGGEVTPAADGGPDAWFTLGGRKRGIGVSNYDPARGTTLEYPNSQEGTTLWFHDHAQGITRFGVFSGMAGMYVIKDPANEPLGLPKGNYGQYDVPLVIQDRSFDTKGQIFYNLASNPQPNPTIHPFWIPEFLGDTIVVNGKTWPFLNVEPRKYRFRLLNGSQSRFYKLYLSDGRSFKVIATDGGYLQTPVDTKDLVFGPGERYEIVIDFAGAAAGGKILLLNNANTPFPDGDAVDPLTTAQVLQFRVVSLKGPDQSVVPNTLRTDFVDLTAAIPANAIKRQLTLNEVSSIDGPLGLVLNNTEYNRTVDGFPTRITELPAVGDTEVWEIINVSADAHPIHIHLVQFQILNRQDFNVDGYLATYGNPPPGQGPPGSYLATNGDGAIGGNPAVGPFLSGGPVLPAPYEKGWKDTAIMWPGQVTRIVVRWAPQDAPAKGTPCPSGFSVPANTMPCVPQPGNNLFPFNPTQLVNGVVGYAWHCHILEHEDNDMMRPYAVGLTRQVP